MNFKKIILALLAISLSFILTVSFAHAQTSRDSAAIPSAPSSSGNDTSNSTKIVPYHPRDPVAYYAEKKQLDSQGANASLSKTLPKFFGFSALSSPVNNPVGFDGLNVTSATFHSNKQDPPDVQVAVGPGNVFEMVNVKGKTYTKTGSTNQTINLDTLFQLTTSTHLLTQPKVLYDSQSGRWFASLLDASSNTHQIKLFNFTGLSPMTFKSIITVNLQSGRPNILTPPSALQPITTTHISTGDTRTLNAVWQNGKLWFSLNDKCTPTGDSTFRSCARLIQINTNTTTVTQDFDVNSSGSYFYYPALTVDSFGGMGAVFGTSNDTDPTGYPGLIVTAQAAADPVNSIKQLAFLRTGTHYEDGKEDSNFNTLYGDYFGASPDPSNNTRIWVAGEYNTLPNGHLVPSWSTFIGSINFDCVPPPSGDWIITASCTLAKSADAPANVIVQNNSLLTIPNGISLNVDFKNHFLLVNSGSGVYIAPSGKIT